MSHGSTIISYNDRYLYVGSLQMSTLESSGRCVMLGHSDLLRTTSYTDFGYQIVKSSSGLQSYETSDKSRRISLRYLSRPPPPPTSMRYASLSLAISSSITIFDPPYFPPSTFSFVNFANLSLKRASYLPSILSAWSR